MIADFFKHKTEEFKERITALTAKKDKSFGIIMAVAFALISLWAWSVGSSHLNVFLGIGAGFLVLAYSIPISLRPLHVVWLLLGLILETFLAPIIMLFIYAVGFVPFALIFKLFGRDELQLKKDTTKTSYWCKRDFKPTADDFKQQF